MVDVELEYCADGQFQEMQPQMLLWWRSGRAREHAPIAHAFDGEEHGAEAAWVEGMVVEEMREHDGALELAPAIQFRWALALGEVPELLYDL